VLQLTRAHLEGWLTSYVRSYVDENSDAFVSLFTTDATYRETPYMEPVHAKDFRAFWDDLAKRSTRRAMQWRIFHIEEDWALVNWKATNSRRGSGELREGDGVFLLHFAADGRCRSVSEWQHWHVLGAPLEKGWPWPE
jgi:hypothetical protein